MESCAAWAEKEIAGSAKPALGCNAVMESFFGRFKVELIYAENYKTVEETHAGIFEYNEMFHNRQRRQSAIGYMCPNEYEKQYNQLNVSTFCG